MPSLVISTYHYDPSLQTLRVTYLSGAVYDYLNVPEHVYGDMKRAFSKGEFLNREIKKHYAFQKIK